jgi:chaperonin GroES
MAVLHGLIFGTGFLLTISGGLAELWSLRPGLITAESIRMTMEVRVRDRVLYSKFAGTEYKVRDEERLLLSESDALAKIAN